MEATVVATPVRSTPPSAVTARRGAGYAGGKAAWRRALSSLPPENRPRPRLHHFRRTDGKLVATLAVVEADDGHCFVGFAYAGSRFVVGATARRAGADIAAGRALKAAVLQQWEPWRGRRWFWTPSSEGVYRSVYIPSRVAKKLVVYLREKEEQGRGFSTGLRVSRHTEDLLASEGLA